MYVYTKDPSNVMKQPLNETYSFTSCMHLFELMFSFVSTESCSDVTGYRGTGFSVLTNHHPHHPLILSFIKIISLLSKSFFTEK